MTSSLKMYTCEASKYKEQCIGVIDIKNEEEKILHNSSNSIDGQRFVARGTNVPINNYLKMNEDQLKSFPYFQNYQKGIPSKVNIHNALQNNLYLNDNCIFYFFRYYM
jgi:hypothetical protein